MRYIVAKAGEREWTVIDMSTARIGRIMSLFEAERTCAWLNDRDVGYLLGHC